MTWIEIAPWLVRALGAYAALGAAFAVPFLARGIERLDSGAHGASWGAHALGLVALTSHRSPDREGDAEPEIEAEVRDDVEERADDELVLDRRTPLERPGAGV